MNIRNVLPNRRDSVSATIEFAGEKYDFTTGFYPDGTVGETFINRVKDRTAAKLGEQLDGICRDSAVLISLALQHGVTIDTMRHAVTRDSEDSPSTLIGAILDTLAAESRVQN